MIELDRPLFEYLRERFPKVRVINGDATRLVDILRQQGVEEVGTVISGIPMVTMPLEFQRAIIEQSFAALGPGGCLLAVLLFAGRPDPGQEARGRGQAGQVRGAQPAARDGLALPPARWPQCRPWPGERARLNDRSPCQVRGRSASLATPTPDVEPSDPGPRSDREPGRPPAARSRPLAEPLAGRRRALHDRLRRRHGRPGVDHGADPRPRVPGARSDRAPAGAGHHRGPGGPQGGHELLPDRADGQDRATGDRRPAAAPVRPPDPRRSRLSGRARPGSRDLASDLRRPATASCGHHRLDHAGPRSVDHARAGRPDDPSGLAAGRHRAARMPARDLADATPRPADAQGVAPDPVAHGQADRAARPDLPRHPPGQGRQPRGRRIDAHRRLDRAAVRPQRQGGAASMPSARRSWRWSAAARSRS